MKMSQRLDQTRVSGKRAIALAEKIGARLYKYNDPIDSARELTIKEAREIADEDPSLVYADMCIHVSEGDDSPHQIHRGSAEKILDNSNADPALRRAVQDIMDGEHEVHTVDAEGCTVRVYAVLAGDEGSF